MGDFGRCGKQHILPLPFPEAGLWSSVTRVRPVLLATGVYLIPDCFLLAILQLAGIGGVRSSYTVGHKGRRHFDSYYRLKGLRHL
jgi:hypothetical protein